MNTKIAILLCLLCCCVFKTNAQEEQLSRIHNNRIKKTLHILQNENKESNLYSNTLDFVINSYCSCVSYVPKQYKEDLFNILYELKSTKKERFFMFLLFNRECFSDQELHKIKQDLSTQLEDGDPYYYHLVSIFQLKSLKSSIEEKVDSDFFEKLDKRFKDHTLSVGFMKGVLPYTAIANLGDQQMEDKLIKLSKEYFSICQRASGIEKQYFYHDYFYVIMMKMLGSLSSKRSVVATLSIMNVDYEFPSKPVDVGAYPLYTEYILNVLKPKVKKIDQIYLDEIIWNVESGKWKKNIYLNEIKNKILSDQLRWQDYLIDLK